MVKPFFKVFAALVLAAGGATSAQAVTFFSSYNFSFSSGSIVSSSGSTAGNSIIFRSTTDPLLRVKATAWSIDTNGTSQTQSDDIVTAATLRLWSGGLGVQNAYESNTSPSHSIDNGIPSGTTKSMVDFVLLQFNYDVDVNSMGTGWVQTDSDASLRFGTGPTSNPSTWSSTPSLDGRPVTGSTGVDLNDFVTISNTALNASGGSSTGTRNVNAANGHGMIWLIGALYGADNNDYFKLSSLNVTVYPTVPEPSTWMTLILGFGFIGASMRRAGARASRGVASAA